MSKEKEPNKLISKKLAKAEALIRECEALADEHSVSFNWNLEYGLGGMYDPLESQEYDEGNHWFPSSQSC